MEHRNWKGFFQVLLVGLVYLAMGLAIALSAVFLSMATENKWLIWVYRIVGPISVSIFLLLSIMAFEVLNEWRSTGRKPKRV